MKLHLSKNNEIQIFSVEGSVNAHDSAILRAGLSKLLKNGHHKIILVFLSPTEIAPTAYGELLVLQRIAREISGDIVLVEPHANSAGQPPQDIHVYSDIESALAYFRPPEKDEVAELPLGTGDPNLLAFIAEQKKTIQQLRDQFKAKGMTDKDKELAQVREQNNALKLSIEAFMKGTRIPASNAAYEDKIATLETELYTLIEQVRANESKLAAK